MEAQKRKLEEIKAEEKNLHEMRQKLKTEYTQAKEAMSYIDEGGQKISEGLKVNDMMKVEAGQKLIEFGREKQTEANKQLDEMSKERDRTEAELFRLRDSKKLKK